MRLPEAGEGGMEGYCLIGRVFCLFRAALMAYGRFQAKGWIGAIVTRDRDLEEWFSHKTNTLETQFHCEILSYPKTCPYSMFSFNYLQVVSTWPLTCCFTCSKVNLSYVLTQVFFFNISSKDYQPCFYSHSFIQQAFTECQLLASCCRYWDKSHTVPVFMLLSDGEVTAHLWSFACNSFLGHFSAFLSYCITLPDSFLAVMSLF